MIIQIKNKIQYYCVVFLSYVYRFEFHKDSGRFHLYPSVKVTNPKYMIIGSNVSLFSRGWIYAIKTENGNPLIHIGKNTEIYENFHITCANRITIGNSCLITRNVLITDSLHNYNDTSIPIISQGIITRETFIDDGCWIGNNCVIVCCTIGKNCVIGANSVLINQNIPDYSVVSGNPAQIIRTIKQKKVRNS